MSGDVQPKKRKDKRKRKEDHQEDVTHQHIPTPAPHLNVDDTNIHVHKEKSVGGGICAKCVFFIITLAIAIVLGFTIVEHRGLTDIDIPISESRFASIFEGWIDTEKSDHDDHEVEEIDYDHHEDDDDEEDEGIGSEEEDEGIGSEEEEEERTGSEEEEERTGSEEEEERTRSEEEVTGSEQEEQGESQEESQQDQEIEEEDEEQQEESEENLEESEQDLEDEEEAETESPEIQAESDEEQPEEESEEQPVEESEEQQIEESEEEPAEESEEEQQAEESEEQQAEESEDQQVEGSEEQPGEESEEQPEEEIDVDQLGDSQEAKPGEFEEEEDEEPTGASDEELRGSKKDRKRSSKKRKDGQKDGDQGDVEDATNAANTGVATKIFVGAALLVVAYVVLIKKWKSEKVEKPTKKEEKDETPNLSRRNTIVPPPTLEEIEQDLENQEEYSEGEEEDAEESEDEIRIPSTKKHYEELRASYTRTLTPEDKEREEYEEEEVEEEEYDDRDEEEEEEDDNDEELLKKLEEKYGKLDTKHQYEEEEDPDEESEEVEEEEDEEEEEEEEDVEDEESWKRVKVSDDQEPESDDEKTKKKRSGAQAYEFNNITNADDFLIRETLDYAQQHLPDNIPLALNLFIKILENYPDSPRALYGRALALDRLAEKKRSNDILQESIKYFVKVLNANNVPDALFLAAANRCIERMRFIGSYAKAIDIHQKLITRFPNEIKHRNEFAVSLLTINRIPQARSLLLETLRKWPKDGFALVHYGFILKTVDNNLPLAIEYLTKGISTKEPGVIDGRFYFHLGDALARIGKPEEAMKIYEDGVAHKVFLSKYQRSLYNVDRLTGRPWWKLEETPYSQLYQHLQRNWKEIRKEGLSVLDKKGYFKDESENLKDVGDWKQFELYARGVKNKENCLKCPVTCQIIDSFPEARTCRRGQVKFSVMHPGTHVWPHCGPTNCRLRVHLGLKVPPKTYIRVAEETRSWEEGKIMMFDDSFEHEVWHNGTEYRLVLIVDVWHPELTRSERINLSPI